LLSWISRFGNNPHAFGRWPPGFQSLLSWISRFGVQRGRWDCGGEAGFNPCCLGLAVLATGTGTVSGVSLGFQSLLSWISRFGREWFSNGRVDRGFQSLLSWISRFGFNLADFRAFHVAVSILVVLD